MSDAGTLSERSMSEYEEESGRLKEMADMLEVLERRVRKRKRSKTDSGSL